MSYYNLLANVRDEHKFPPKGFDSTNYPREAIVTVTSAQLLAANTTPVSLIASPGEDKFIVIDQVIAFLDHGGTDYAGSGELQIRYTDGSGAEVVDGLAEVAFLEASADVYAVRHGLDCVPVSAAAVVLYAATADPTTGDGVLKMRIKYRIVTFA